VIQEWWGLNPNIESFCRRFADEGFVAVAPDLYRGALTTEPDEAKKLMMRLDRPRAVEDLRAGLSMLMDRGATKVGAMGFCMGGYLTHELALSDDRLGAAVACYGLTDPKDRELLAPMQVHRRRGRFRRRRGPGRCSRPRRRSGCSPTKGSARVHERHPARGLPAGGCGARGAARIPSPRSSAGSLWRSPA
jgi:hypothetical protein